MIKPQRNNFLFFLVRLTVCLSSKVWLFWHNILTVSNKLFSFGNYSLQDMQYLFRSSQIKEPMFVVFFFTILYTTLLRFHNIHDWRFSWLKKNSFSNIHHTLVKFTAVDRRFFLNKHILLFSGLRILAASVDL